MNAASQPKQLYVYLSSEGIDSFIQFALVPAGIVGCPAFLHFIWTDFGSTKELMRVAINYGVVISSVKLCRIIGVDFIFHALGWVDGSSSNLQSQQMLSFLLVVCCVLLTFPAIGNNLYAVEFICCFMSLVGSILSESFSYHVSHYGGGSGLPMSAGHPMAASTSASGPPSITGSAPTAALAAPLPPNSYYSPDNKLRRHMIAFVFVANLTALLFHEDANMTISKIQPTQLYQPPTPTLPLQIHEASVLSSGAHPVVLEFSANCRFYLYLLFSAFTLLMFLYHVYTGLHKGAAAATFRRVDYSSNSSSSEDPNQNTSKMHQTKGNWLFSIFSRASKDKATSSNTPLEANISNGALKIATAPLDFVIPDPLIIPPNFVAVSHGDSTKARDMYVKSLRWRHTYNVDNILDNPQTHFADVVQYYPHAIHGISVDQCVVLYEVLGKAKPRELLARGITTEHLIWHFNLRNEFVFQKFKHLASQSSPVHLNGGRSSHSGSSVVRIMTVVDVKGISIYDFTTDVVSFIKQSSEVMDENYPGQVERLVIVNAPSWFYSVWSVVTRVLPESVKKKIIITNDAKKLDEFIVPTQRPVDYGGTDVPLGQWKAHLEFMQIPNRWQSAEPAVDASHGLSTALGPEVTTASSLDHSSEIEATAELGSKTPPSLWSWVTNKFRRSSNNDGHNNTHSENKKATTAFLGEKNQYKYDVENGTWMLDASSDSSSSDSSFDSDEGVTAEEGPDNDCVSDDRSHPRFKATQKIVNQKISSSGKKTASEPSAAELEEHALLLAIQAAHYANLSNRNHSSADQRSKSDSVGMHQSQRSNGMGLNLKVDTSNNFNNSSNNNSNDSSNSVITSSRQRGSAGSTPTISSQSNSITENASSSGYSHINASSTVKLSSEVFVVVISIFVLATSVHSSLLAVMPMWLYSPKDVGGGGYSVQNVALMCSASAFTLLVADTYIRQRLLFLLKSSPLRAIRIGCGTLMVATALLPFFLTSTANSYRINVSANVYSHSYGYNESFFAGIHDFNTSRNSGVKWAVSGWFRGYSSIGALGNSSFISGGASTTSGVQYSSDVNAIVANHDAPSSPFSRSVSAFIGYVYSMVFPQQSAAVTAVAESAEPSQHVRIRLLMATDVSERVHPTAMSQSDINVETKSHSVPLALPAKLSDSPLREEEESIVHLVIPCILLSAIVASSYLCRRASVVLLKVALAPVFAEPKSLVRIATNVIDTIVPFLSCLVYSAIYDLTLPYPLNALNFLSLSVCVCSLLYVCTLLLDLKFLGDFGVIFDETHSSGTHGSGGYNNTGTAGRFRTSASTSTRCCRCIESTPVLQELVSIPADDIGLLFARPKFGYGSKLYNLKVDVKDV